jgi:hypothetical protein
MKAGKDDSQSERVATEQERFMLPKNEHPTTAMAVAEEIALFIERIYGPQLQYDAKLRIAKLIEGVAEGTKEKI